ncbi:DsbA family protein [Shewanella abyssi]|uniref:DsbA family oxidoreductase n=1 Tax=Shewanella abyssi TaxID=311789 RepID=UPI00200DC98D|nr:DsbA family protein [Shewanella abyssi]MCL1049165.1 DsbA family protein [Shewanella abyssi]
MNKTITIYTDYVCPYCLLAEHVIAEVIKDKEITIRWRPFELRPHPVPTLRMEDSYLPDIWQSSVYPMAARLGVPIKLPNISPQPRTDKAFQVFAMAEEQGLGHAFTMSVMKAFFQKEKDIGDPEILADLAADIGLERNAVLSALEEGIYSASHLKAQRHAVEDAQISSVPTIVVGQKTFTGVPTPSELLNAIDALEQTESNTKRNNFLLKKEGQKITP